MSSCSFLFVVGELLVNAMLVIRAILTFAIVYGPQSWRIWRFNTNIGLRYNWLNLLKIVFLFKYTCFIFIFYKINSIFCYEIAMNSAICTKFFNNFYGLAIIISICVAFATLDPIQKLLFNLLLFNQLFNLKITFLAVISICFLCVFLQLRKSWVLWNFIKMFDIIFKLNATFSAIFISQIFFVKHGYLFSKVFSQFVKIHAEIWHIFEQTVYVIWILTHVGIWYGSIKLGFRILNMF